MCEGLILDQTANYSPPLKSHDVSVTAAMRFVNSESDFEPAAVGALLRQLQGKACEERQRWWIKV